MNAEVQPRVPHNSLRVLMIVPNPCVRDSRVIKEARTLAGAGHVVRVLCKADGRARSEEVIDGVEYRRVPMDRLPWFWPDWLPRRRALLPAPAAGGTREPDPSVQSEESVADFLWKCARFAAALVIRCCRLGMRMAFRLVGTTLVLPLDTVLGEARAFRPDVIHAHDLAPLPAAVRLGRMLNAAVVYDAHELETHRNGLGFLARRQAAIVEGRAIRAAAAVITVCDSIARFLADLYGISDPIVIMNAPEPPAESGAGRGIREAAGVSMDTPLAIYVGNVTFGRGLEQLVDAMAHCPEFHVAMLGPRVDWVYERLLKRARRLGVAARLHFVESVAPDTVVDFIRGADIGVVPIQDVCLSYRFCMPNKLFEMTFAGVPACVSDLPEMRAFVEREGTGVVMNQTDPADIAAKMRELYRRRDEFRADGARRQRLIEEYSWGRQAGRLLDLYALLAGSGRAAPASQAVPAGK